jgi:DNA-binding transcriptional LysR family regulator
MKRSIHAALPSVDSLIVFEQAATTLSFTKAGLHLGLTQSAVSRQVIDLEGLLQVKLFAREKQRLRLTNQGAEFRELVRPIIQDLRAATLRMQMGSVQRNVLNISVAASFCNLWFEYWERGRLCGQKHR